MKYIIRYYNLAASLKRGGSIGDRARSKIDRAPSNPRAVYHNILAYTPYVTYLEGTSCLANATEWGAGARCGGLGCVGHESMMWMWAAGASGFLEPSMFSIGPPPELPGPTA